MFDHRGHVATGKCRPTPRLIIAVIIIIIIIIIEYNTIIRRLWLQIDKKTLRNLSYIILYCSGWCIAGVVTH